jgi:hypothetical protein
LGHVQTKKTKKTRTKKLMRTERKSFNS